jgi:sulfide:quinone oxidoreductase
MPKQAHMADLQARAAAANLLAALAGRKPTARFKVELACIIDSLDRAPWSGAPPRASACCRPCAPCTGQARL